MNPVRCRDPSPATAASSLLRRLRPWLIPGWKPIEPLPPFPALTTPPRATLPSVDCRRGGDPVLMALPAPQLLPVAGVPGCPHRVSPRRTTPPPACEGAPRRRGLHVVRVVTVNPAGPGRLGQHGPAAHPPRRLPRHSQPLAALPPQGSPRPTRPLPGHPSALVSHGPAPKLIARL
jgi:hypothetical protein